MAHRFKSSDFGPYINDRFSIHVKSRKRPISATLIELKIHHADHAEDTSHGAVMVKRGFSLLFRCSKRTKLEQDTYSVEHKELGKGEIFLVPVERDHGGKLYEAVFNYSPSVAHDEPELLEVQEKGYLPLVELKPAGPEKAPKKASQPRTSATKKK